MGNNSSSATAREAELPADPLVAQLMEVCGSMPAELARVVSDYVGVSVPTWSPAGCGPRGFLLEGKGKDQRTARCVRSSGYHWVLSAQPAGALPVRFAMRIDANPLESALMIGLTRHTPAELTAFRQAVEDEAKSDGKGGGGVVLELDQYLNRVQDWRKAQNLRWPLTSDGSGHTSTSSILTGADQRSAHRVGDVLEFHLGPWQSAARPLYDNQISIALVVWARGWPAGTVAVKTWSHPRMDEFHFGVALRAGCVVTFVPHSGPAPDLSQRARPKS